MENRNKENNIMDNSIFKGNQMALLTDQLVKSVKTSFIKPVKHLSLQQVHLKRPSHKLTACATATFYVGSGGVINKPGERSRLRDHHADAYSIHTSVDVDIPKPADEKESKNMYENKLEAVGPIVTTSFRRAPSWLNHSDLERKSNNISMADKYKSTHQITTITDTVRVQSEILNSETGRMQENCNHEITSGRVSGPSSRSSSYLLHDTVKTPNLKQSSCSVCGSTSTLLNIQQVQQLQADGQVKEISPLAEYRKHCQQAQQNKLVTCEEDSKCGFMHTKQINRQMTKSQSHLEVNNLPAQHYLINTCSMYMIDKNWLPSARYSDPYYKHMPFPLHQPPSIWKYNQCTSIPATAHTIMAKTTQNILTEQPSQEIGATQCVSIQAMGYLRSETKSVQTLTFKELFQCETKNSCIQCGVPLLTRSMQTFSERQICPRCNLMETLSNSKKSHRDCSNDFTVLYSSKVSTNNSNQRKHIKKASRRRKGRSVMSSGNVSTDSCTASGVKKSPKNAKKMKKSKEAMLLAKRTAILTSSTSAYSSSKPSRHLKHQQPAANLKYHLRQQQRYKKKCKHRSSSGQTDADKVEKSEEIPNCSGMSANTSPSGFSSRSNTSLSYQCVTSTKSQDILYETFVQRRTKRKKRDTQNLSKPRSTETATLQHQKLLHKQAQAKNHPYSSLCYQMHSPRQVFKQVEPPPQKPFVKIPPEKALATISESRTLSKRARTRTSAKQSHQPTIKKMDGSSTPQIQRPCRKHTNRDHLASFKGSDVHNKQNSQKSSGHKTRNAVVELYPRPELSDASSCSSVSTFSLESDDERACMNARNVWKCKQFKTQNQIYGTVTFGVHNSMKCRNHNCEMLPSIPRFS